MACRPARGGAPLIQARDGFFYGTTTGGGTFDKGTVFRMDARGEVVLLRSFSGPDGDYPEAGLVEARDGRLLGTTYYGGANETGAIFALVPVL